METATDIFNNEVYMVGYVVAYKPDMKIREYELYSAYYCGVCKSIGRRFGMVPRLVLSYDSAFLAIVLDALSSKKEKIEKQHCIVHPLKKKNICVSNAAVDYAADMMIILAYHKLIDDINDDNSMKARIMKPLFGSAYRELNKKYRKICDIAASELASLSQMEKESCDSIDRISDAFAKIMEAVLSGYEEGVGRGDRLALKSLGFYLGKWMYLIDAYDDIKENIEDKNYNPLLYRFGFEPEKEDAQSFTRRITDRIELLLFSYLAEMGKAFDLMSIRKNEGIAANIIYMGLRKKTEEVLKKGKNNDERPL